VQDGRDVSYYENGRMKHKGQNSIGVKTGIWYHYSEQVELSVTETWIAGQLQNTEKHKKNDN
jgi:antitoxin component YwqK of YwqJK toxin-antitoxin module